MSVGAQARNWTETLGNTIFFEGLDSTSYFLWLDDRMKQPPPLIAPFLHEFTHHWCFCSLVGNVMAFAELRLHALSGRAPAARGVCARDHLALACLSNLLRPIAEGMALFAEFDLDAAPGESNLGTPMTAASLCFAQENGGPFHEMMLQGLRRSADHIDRKASAVYLGDFEIREGYLPGYMLVKSLFLAMSAKVPGLSSEVFLAYLRCYLWEDPGFAAVFATIDSDGPNVAKQIINHFLVRIDTLRLASDLPERVAEFWQAWSAPGLFRPGPGLFVEPDDNEAVLSQMSATSDAIFGFLVSTAAKNDFADMCPVGDVVKLAVGLANLRRFTVVARVAARVRSDGDRWALILRPLIGPERQILWYTQTRPEDGDYEYFAIIPNFAAYMVCLLRRGDKVIVIGQIGHFDPTRHFDDIVAFVTELDRSMAIIQALRSDFETVGYPAIRAKSLELALAECEEHALEVYLTLIAYRGPTDPEKVELERGLLRASGLQSLFADDPEALRTLAAISLLPHHLISLHEFDLEGQLTLTNTFVLRGDLEVMRKVAWEVIKRDQTRLLLHVEGNRARVLV